MFGNMTRLLNTLIGNRCAIPWFYKTVRYAGHNKWSNIKHVKASEDAKRQMLFSQLRRAMALAIKEGDSANPDENVKLKHILDKAKMANMPSATIQKYLENLKSDKSKQQSYIAEIKGSGGYSMIVNFVTENHRKSLNEIKGKLKKYGAKLLETKSKGSFDHFCIVYAEKDCTLDQALEDAIVAGAEDVDVQEGEIKAFQFKCNAEDGSKVMTRLKSLKYNIFSLEDMFIPLTLVQLDEDDRKLANELTKQLLQFDIIEKIEHNIEDEEG